MTFSLIKHTDLDELARSFANLYMQRPEDMQPLDSDYLIVQTPGMKKWLSLETARLCGSFARVEVLTPVQFVMKLGVLLLNFREKRTIFEKDILPWAIYRILQADFAAGVEEVEPLLRYCSQDDQPTELRCYSLADSMADLFDQYMLSRPDWPALWERNRRIRFASARGTHGQEADPHRPEEIWQAHTWRRLLEIGGDNPSRADYFDRLEKAVDGGKAARHLPRRIFLFGMSLLPPRFLRIFAKLGKLCRVTLFLQVPSIYYTGDLQSDKTLDRIAAHHPGTDVELLKSIGGNRLLANLGRTGREFMDLIIAQNPREEDDNDRFWAEAEADDVQGTLLGELQRNVRLCSNPRSLPEETVENQWSIRVARCTGELREVEVLHDLLLESLRDLDGLTPSDILVVTPDIERYGPLIDLVFGGGKERCGVKIPYSIADRSLLTEDRTARLAADLLAAVAERFSLVHILPLFEECCHVMGEPLDEIRRELLHTHCVDAGIRWGFNEDFKRRMGIRGGGILTWEAGLDRLFAGFAVDGEAPIDGDLFPARTFVGQEAEVLGRLSLFVETLGRLAALTGESRTCMEWVNEVRPLFSRLLSSEGQEDDEAPPDPFYKAFETIVQRLEVAGLQDMPLSFALFSRVLAGELAAPAADGKFLTGALTVAGMVPMRSLPFRVIALLGMNRGKFPRHTVRPEYDLMRHERRPGDRDTLASDQYLFLEIVLAARDRLIVTTSGLTDKGEPAPASSVVEELVHELDREFTVNGTPAGKAVTMNYPLQPGSPRYRSTAEQDSRLTTFNHRWFIPPPGKTVPMNLFHWRSLAMEREPEMSVVDGEEILRGLSDPAGWFLRNACGIFREREEAGLPETEMFALDNLSAWQVRDTLLQELCNEAGLVPLEEAHAVGRLKAEGMIPPGHPGDFALDAEKKTIQKRVERLRVVFPNPRFQFKKYHFTRNGKEFRHTAFVASDVGKAALIDAGRVKAKRRLRHWITHLFENLSGPVETTLVCLDTTITLPPIEEPQAEDILVDLALLTREAAGRFLPLFPEAAWAYCSALGTKDKDGNPTSDPVAQAWKQMEEPLGNKYNQTYGEDPWIKKAFGEADSFAAAGIEDEFCELSVRLFGRLVELHGGRQVY